MDSFQAIIFDMDGVVIDTKPGIEKFWQQLASQYGFSISEEVMEEYIHGCPVWLTFEKVFPMMSKNDQDQWLSEIHNFEAKLMYEPLTGISSFLASIHAHDIPIALVTSGYLKKVGKVFKQLGYTDYFQQVVTADMVSHGKPHPEPYLMAAEKLGIDPENCVVFEDSISGITSAMAAGMFPVGINKAILESRLINAGAKKVVQHFEHIEFEKHEEQIGIRYKQEWVAKFNAEV